MIKLQDFIAARRARKFEWGYWDCVHFILEWAEAKDPRAAYAILKYLYRHGYRERVLCEDTYRDFLRSNAIRLAGELQQVFVENGFIPAERPKGGDIAVDPSGALGIVGEDLKVTYLHPQKGLTTIKPATGTRYLKCQAL